MKRTISSAWFTIRHRNTLSGRREIGFPPRRQISRRLVLPIYHSMPLKPVSAQQMKSSRHGHNPNVTDTYHRTPVSWAAENGHEEAVELLVKRGADLNLTDKLGRTPLSYAAQNGHKAVVELLLVNSGIHPDWKDSGERTPLSYAAEGGHEKVVTLLLAKDGVNPDSRDKNNRTPLSWAAEKGHEVLVEMLLEKDGVNPDSKGRIGQHMLEGHGRTP